MSSSTVAAQSAVPMAFDFHSRTRIVFGAGKIQQVGEIAAGLGGKRVLMVTDKGIVAAGHASRVRDILEGSGMEVTVFADAMENPTTSCVEKCLEAARPARIDLIFGLGGGSAMDTAKGCNFLLTNGGRVQDYWGVGKAKLPMLPFIAAPTTAGTGSECQSAALIADEVTHQKMACLDEKAAARVAILDPELTLSQPPKVAACTGIDAVAHAIESAVTTKRTALSSMLSREAFRLCANSFPIIMSAPGDIEARGSMLLGAALAGLAIENSMLGAAHAAANPLTAHYGIAHGKAVGLMLPSVIRFNADEPAASASYGELLQQSDSSSTDLAEAVEGFLEAGGFPKSLKECGVRSGDVEMLAEEAARQWTATFNPRPAMKEDFVRLYMEALEGYDRK
jgi:alcohol dehydrogenase